MKIFKIGLLAIVAATTIQARAEGRLFFQPIRYVHPSIVPADLLLTYGPANSIKIVLDEDTQIDDLLRTFSTAAHGKPTVTSQVYKIVMVTKLDSDSICITGDHFLSFCSAGVTLQFLDSQENVIEQYEDVYFNLESRFETGEQLYSNGEVGRDEEVKTILTFYATINGKSIDKTIALHFDAKDCSYPRK